MYYIYILYYILKLVQALPPYCKNGDCTILKYFTKIRVNCLLACIFMIFVLNYTVGI